MRNLMLVAIVGLLGCSGSDDSDPTSCAANETVNPVTGACEGSDDTGTQNNTDMGSSNGTDGGANNVNTGSDTGNRPPDMTMATPDMPVVNTNWPPAIESLYSPGACMVPACDSAGEPGFDPSGMWVTTLTTAESDCSDFIKGQDARANVGNVDVSAPEPLSTFSGQCGANDMGTQISTAINAIVATCAENPQDFGVVSFETSVLEYNGDVGMGQAFVYLENVPSFVGSDCFMRFEIVDQRQ